MASIDCFSWLFILLDSSINPRFKIQDGGSNKFGSTASSYTLDTKDHKLCIFIYNTFLAESLANINFYRLSEQPQSWGLHSPFLFFLSKLICRSYVQILTTTSSISISRDSRHKRSATGAKRATYRKKRYAS